MAGLRRLFAIAIITAGIISSPGQAFAARKATDLMSEALRQRAAGNLTEAISNLEYASEQAMSPIQKSLAGFMLGDCLLEAGRFADASRIFMSLAESVSTSEEKAEALFRLMQAHSGLGSKDRVTSIYAQIRRDHGDSPYFELARAFMKTEGFKEAAEEKPLKVAAVPEKPAPAPVAAPAVAAKPDFIEAEPESEAAEATNSEPVEAVESTVESVTEPVPEPAAEPVVKPVKKEKTAVKPQPQFEEAVEEPQAATAPEKPAKSSKPAKSAAGLKKTDSETTAILARVLHIEPAAGREKEELVSKILGLQDALKDGPDKAGMDQVLLDLAEATTRFGEFLEACKTYDKVLTHHPASPLVERAYFEAIRLRAILGVHEAVIGWSKAFLAAFPASEYRSSVRALVEYAQAGGKIDLGAAAPAGTAATKTAPAAGGDNDSANAALAADSQYVSASRKMKDGRYNLALVDFNRLSGKYPAAPQIWWDIALVQVQLEDFKKAAQAINKMLQLDPGNQDANSLSGYIHYRLENYEEAASAYDQAGEPEGRGVTFFDAKTASERMKKSAGSK